MSLLDVAALALGILLVLYGALLAALLAAGRRTDARALAGFVPDCAVLFRRLLRDPRVGPRARVAVLGLIGYLLLPFDLVPDFLPVVGQLDDALLVALVLRVVLRSAGPDLVAEHWPGPEVSRRAVERLAFGEG